MYFFFRKILVLKLYLENFSVSHPPPAPPNCQRSAFCFVKMYMRMLSSYYYVVYIYILYIVMSVYMMYIALFDLLLLLDISVYTLLFTAHDFGYR